MTQAIELLEQLRSCGVSVSVDQDELVLRPGNKVPADLLPEVRQHKAGIIEQLRDVDDGQPPPLDRPLRNEQEMRRWMDHTADPEVFDRWLEWAISYTDPVEDSPCPEDTPSG
jgi:hypothetical protein